ncbi:MAG TPA: YggT family protein [Thermoanaerobaculia bacterium]|nr:YggT family protein [Thermoanaerobaculia bacterium]
MNVGGAFLRATLEVVFAILSVIQWLVIIAAVISWVNPDPRNPIVQFLYRTTEPILRPFRKILPPQRTGGIDLSPILVILLILFLKVFLSSMFMNAARAF